MKTIKYLYAAIWALLILGACSKDQESDNVAMRITTVGVAEVYSVQATAVGRSAQIAGVSYTERGFIYQKEGAAQESSEPRKIVSTSEGDRFEAIVDGLEPQTEYRVTAYAIDAAGSQMQGSPVSFITTKSTTARIAVPVTESVTAKTAVLSARMVDDGGVPASLFGVEYLAEGETQPRLYTIPGAPRYTVRSGATFKVEIPLSEGLIPGKLYSAKMYARNDVQGVYTTAFSFRMLEVEAPQVQTASEPDGKPGKTAITLTSKLLCDGNDPETDFGVAYKLDATAADTPDDSWTRVAGTQLNEDRISYTITVTGLTVSSTYGMAAYAVNDLKTVYGNVLVAQTEQLTDPETEAYAYNPTEFDAFFGETSDYNVGQTHIYLKASITKTGGHEFTKCGFLFADNPSFTNAAEVEASSKNSSSFWVKKVGLTSGKRYYYKTFVETSTEERFVDKTVASVSTAAIYDQDGTTRLYLMLKVAGGSATTAVTLGPKQDTPLFYYELPPVEVSVGDNKFNYYFLDRNLGASKAPTAGQLDVTDVSAAMADYVGYYFQLGRKLPSASSDAYNFAASGGLASLATNNYGWNGTNSNTSWAEAENPCPKGYRIPTKEEFEAFLAAKGNDVPAVRSHLNACVTGIRAAGNGGLASGTNRNQICFYLTTGIYNLYNDTPAFIVNAAQGAPVRCLRTEQTE